MESSKNRGGAAHVRYEHVHYPRVVELVCRTCGAQAKAVNVDVPEEVAHFMDTAPFEKIWRIQCPSCGERLGCDWEGLKEWELWWRTELVGVDLWAWNEEHLQMIIRKLRKEELENETWHWFESYIPGRWLKKLSKPQAWRKLSKWAENK